MGGVLLLWLLLLLLLLSDIIVDSDGVDLVPLDLHVPKATSQRCRSVCDLAFKQKNNSPGIMKSKRKESCGWTKLKESIN